MRMNTQACIFCSFLSQRMHFACRRCLFSVAPYWCVSSGVSKNLLQHTMAILIIASILFIAGKLHNAQQDRNDSQQHLFIVTRYQYNTPW